MVGDSSAAVITVYRHVSHQFSALSTQAIEVFVQTALGMSIEVGRAPVGIGASATGVAIAAALPPVR